MGRCALNLTIVAQEAAMAHNTRSGEKSRRSHRWSGMKDVTRKLQLQLPTQCQPRGSLTSLLSNDPSIQRPLALRY
jgi:hypothetical protein